MEYFEMIDAAMMCPDRDWGGAEEFGEYVYARLVRYGCERWTRDEVLAVIVAFDERPKPEGTVSFTIRL